MNSYFDDLWNGIKALNPFSDTSLWTSDPRYNAVPQTTDVLPGIVNYATGSLSSSQVAAIRAQLQADLQRAGGSSTDVAAGLREFDGYVKNYLGGYVDTDTITNAINAAKSAFAGLASSPGLSATVFVVGAVLVLWIVLLVAKKL